MFQFVRTPTARPLYCYSMIKFVQVTTLKYLVYGGDKALQPIFYQLFLQRRYELRVVEKEYKQEFVTENSKPVRRMAKILRQSRKFQIYKIYV